MTTPRADAHSSLPGASEVLRSLGLLVDGPQTWGGEVRSRAPGIFIVELPGGADSAPIDIAAVRQWLERVPGLLLDGEPPPTPKELAARLSSFWLPAEPILYVGRSVRSIGARVAAMYATRLGDARPYAGGHWLKTLSVLPRLRVWWAETDAHEEYEDAVLSEVARRASDADDGAASARAAGLPFANLSAAGGAAKSHGLTRYLREGVDAEEGPRAGASRPAPPRKSARAAVRLTADSATPRRRTPAKRVIDRPVVAPSYLSQDGLERLQSELEELRTNVRPEVIERVKAARELGDLRENAEYESARKEQSFMEGRIQALEAMIKAAVVVDAPQLPDAAGVGSTVVVEADGEEQTFVLVGASEADPSAGRISYSSPVGQALLGQRVGDEVTARLPRGEITFRVVEVR